MIRTLLTRKSLAVVALLIVLAVGMAAASAVASPSRSLDETTLVTTTDPPLTTTEATTATTTTDPVTTTDTATTTTATDPATTTAGTTTTDAVTTTATTPVDLAPANTTTADVTTNQTGNEPAVTTQASTAPTAPPPAPCVQQPTVVATCGNNASSQIAIVTQNCTSSASSIGGLQVNITSESGAPISSQIVANSVCLNYSQIFQLVQQICIQCQLVVQNFYSTTNNNSSTNTTVVNNHAPEYTGYCMPLDHPVMRGDGTVGWLILLQTGQPSWDPNWKDAKVAEFDPKLGYTCPGTAPAVVPNAFTLTVPASLIGQYVNLCIQPSDPKAKPICHSVKIDGTAKVTMPLSGNVAVSVTKKPFIQMKPLKPLTKKQLKALAARYTHLAHPTTPKKVTK